MPSIIACSKSAEEKTASRLAGPAPVAVQVQAVGTLAGAQTQTYSGTIEAETTASLASLCIPLPVGQKAAPTVAVAPQLVLQEADGASVVYVADAARKTAQRRRVVLGPVQGNQVVVSQGLAANDQIIVAGQQRLHDGQAIRIIQ